jgi:hypothetical protein
VNKEMLHVPKRARINRRQNEHLTEVSDVHSVGREGFEPSKLSQQIYSLPPLAAWVPTRVNLPR